MTTTATSRRTGCSTSNRAHVLNAPIPAGGFGRALTSAERAELRALGWRRVSERAIVVREVANLDHIGVVYYPATDPAEHAYTSAGIHVQLGAKASLAIDKAAFASIAAAELGRRGGSARTPAKVAASRANGRRGGRPKRQP
ncbi:MAG: hypothetical protein BWX64_02550 [Acidobacteria bacterium ADurb.Bin051]|jgi:hypothetical protein|nr:MAG: hypothetical protein BWX64_02550 [Acidobacteria bacterium ADurb.Bin051]